MGRKEESPGSKDMCSHDRSPLPVKTGSHESSRRAKHAVVNRLAVLRQGYADSVVYLMN